MTTLIDFGNQGLIGVLTPQANTTVEPEFWSLLPAGWSMINARLTSSLNTIEDRLLDYTTQFSSTAEQFANAPIEAIAIACTGTSYLIGIDEELRILNEMRTRFGVPCITAGQATVAALKTLGATRLAMLSPYPESLNRASTAYWEAQGFTVIDKAGPALKTDAFHPIYAMTAPAVYRAYERLSDSGADAVVMLGTGMATLLPLYKGFQSALVPALSCNLALAWHTVQSAKNQPVCTDSLKTWMSGEHWIERMNSILGS